jgi:hypothetical protein
MAACIKAMTHFKKFNKRFSIVFALKLTEYLYRTWLSPSTLSTPSAPDSKHNNALYLPPALILPLRCRHGAGLRTERDGSQTKKKEKKTFLFSRLGAAYGVHAPFRVDVGVGVGVGVVPGLVVAERVTNSHGRRFEIRTIAPCSI